MVRRKLSAYRRAIGLARGLPVTVSDSQFSRARSLQLAFIHSPSPAAVTECPEIANLTAVANIYTRFNSSSHTLDSKELAARNSSLLKITVNGRRVGNRATFSCTSGYGLVGSNELICMDNGQWSSGLPSCEGMHFLFLARRR